MTFQREALQNGNKMAERPREETPSPKRQRISHRHRHDFMSLVLILFSQSPARPHLRKASRQRRQPPL